VQVFSIVSALTAELRKQAGAEIIESGALFLTMSWKAPESKSNWKTLARKRTPHVQSYRNSLFTSSTANQLQFARGTILLHSVSVGQALATRWICPEDRSTEVFTDLVSFEEILVVTSLVVNIF
jgi:hypothetical protein